MRVQVEWSGKAEREFLDWDIVDPTTIPTQLLESQGS
jgi:hypothetical protein